MMPLRRLLPCLAILLSPLAVEAGSPRPRIWLETNGLGSVIAGTETLTPLSSYHTLLTGVNAAGDRVTWVNDLEARIEGPDGRSTALSHDHVTRFTSVPWPTWTFALPDGTQVAREALFLRGTTRAVIRHTLTQSQGPRRLVLAPLMSGRRYGHLRDDYSGLGRHSVTESGATVSFRLGREVPAFRMLHNGSWTTAPRLTAERPYPMTGGREKLWSPGELSFALRAGQDALIAWEPSSAARNNDLAALRASIDGERARRERRRRGILSEDPRLVSLGAASEDYVFRRNDGKLSVLAGFPWFLDWGRDTFISLEGLLLAQGRVEEALEILKTFALYERDGLLPNMFPSIGAEPAYNSVDAPLWFCVLVSKALDYGASPKEISETLFPTVGRILDAYLNGTRYGIITDDRDGLVRAGVPGTQLTWMDVKIGDWVVTPRIGKPVEINALWVAALRAGIRLGERAGADSSRTQAWTAALLKATTHFERAFFDPVHGMLRDVIDGPDSLDARRLRPNALFALSLAPGLVSTPNAERALSLIERKLLVPMGLRTLSPDDSDYHGRYEGEQVSRDLAYHRGTAWAFLIGAYADAVLNVRGPGAASEVWQKLEPLMRHSAQDSTGHAAEVFDGDEPHWPGGCFAQAWSDAELIRVAVKLGKLRFQR